MIEELLHRVAILEAELAKRDEELAKRDVLIAALQARLNKNSQNSSKPPSSDGPGFVPRKKKKSKRNRGGQPGHAGVSRKQLPTEQVDKVVAVGIEGPCSHCGETEVCGLHVGRRHQVWELPQIKPHVTEYALAKGRCGGCNRRRTAELPAGVTNRLLGDRAQAVLTMLTAPYRLSRLRSEELIRDVFGLHVALGTVSNTEDRISQAMRPAYQEALAATRNAKVVHADETGHKRVNKRLWTWILAAKKSVVYKVGHRRKRRVLKSMLGSKFTGVVVSDRYNAYSYLPLAKHQLCWAHMLRAYQAVAERAGETGQIGQRLVELTQDVFCLWRNYREYPRERADIIKQIGALRWEMKQLLGNNLEISELRSWAHVFWLESPKVWNFLSIPGVEPTNNLAERDLRCAESRAVTL